MACQELPPSYCSNALLAALHLRLPSIEVRHISIEVGFTVTMKRSLEGGGESGRHEDDPTENQAETPVNSEQTQENSPATNSATSFLDAGEACIPDDQGRYGSSEGKTQQIEYAYQMETKPDVVSQIVSFQIIPEIERRVSVIVVPVMFEQACSRSGTRQRRLQARGFTPHPPDKIMPNGECVYTCENAVVVARSLYASLVNTLSISLHHKKNVKNH